MYFVGQIKKTNTNEPIMQNIMVRHLIHELTTTRLPDNHHQQKMNLCQTSKYSSATYDASDKTDFINNSIQTIRLGATNHFKNFQNYLQQLLQSTN